MDPDLVLEVLRERAREALAQAPPSEAAQRDQAAALWRNFLTDMGVTLTSPDQLLGIVAGLRLGAHAVDMSGIPAEHAVLLQQLMFGAQNLVLSMDPLDPSTFPDHSEGE
jgi:hypothetical protein